MKSILFITCLFISSISFAKVQLELNMKVNKTKETINKKIDLEKKYTQKLNNSKFKVEYTLSNQRPKNYPEEYGWTEDSIFIKAQIIDKSTNKIVATPEITTLIGKNATVSIEDESPKKGSTSIHLDFKTSKL